MSRTHAKDPDTGEELASAAKLIMLVCVLPPRWPAALPRPVHAA
jgi:hypothetical protein